AEFVAWSFHVPVFEVNATGRCWFSGAETVTRSVRRTGRACLRPGNTRMRAGVSGRVHPPGYSPTAAAAPAPPDPPATPPPPPAKAFQGTRSRHHAEWPGDGPRCESARPSPPV